MRYRGLVLTLVMIAGLGGGLHAQAVDVAVDPLTCWWRASTGFIRIGEPFTVTLTCAVVETQSTTVVADQSRLDPSVMQLPPFEVTGGSHGADVRTTGRRFFQYEYQLRLLAENLFGADATVPSLQVTYHVETRAGQGEATKGRDLTYQLPALTLRVSSLVPDVTRDIREAPGVSLSEIDSLRLRANTLRLVGGLLVAVGVLLALAALVSLFRRRRAAQTETDTTLPPRRVLKGAIASLHAVQRESQQSGWSQESAGRALAAVRIAASYALGRPVGQRPIGDDAALLDGQLLLNGGFGSRSEAAISGAVTSETIGKALHTGSRNGNQLTLEELRDALSGLTSARYARQDELPGDTLDDAVASGLRASERLAADYTWIATARRAAAQRLSAQTRRVWKR